MKPKRQYVWFVRYGLTEHPLVEDLGPYDSDIDPTVGIEHATCIAKRIADGICKGVDDDNSVPTVVYASPFLRTAHTGYIVANELQSKSSNDKVELRLEEGLWEWLIPSLLVTKCDGIKTHPMPVDILSKKLVELEQPVAAAATATATIAIDYRSVNPYDDSGDEGVTCVPERVVPDTNGITITTTTTTTTRRPRWIESETDLLERCASTLNGLLANHDDTGASLCVVSHAPCDQAMAFCLEAGASTPEESGLTPWPLGGITVFSRPVVMGTDGDGSTAVDYGEWTMDLYGNTEHMPGEYQTGLKEWSLPCFCK